ncbi:MAG: DUF4835 family protein [Flavobacteriales bacterium]|nr:DUF4835 family protein [Flavobacteriales bacterium]
MLRQLALLVLLFAPLAMLAQELNCTVQVVAPTVSNVDPARFKTMEEQIKEFMNSRKWTTEDYDLKERIEVSIMVTITTAPTQTSFSGTIMVQSSRPVYNSDYKTPIFTVNDGDFDFTFLDNQIIQFSLDQHRDNLSSVLAYYAYMVIATDDDTFAMEGGTNNYLKAQTVVANAQNAAESGWKASEGQRNRYWLVENIISQTFRPLRKCLYLYHRQGFDKLYTNAENSRKEIADAIIELRNIHKVRPSSYNVQLFFSTKGNELVKLFSPSPEAERQRILPILKELDPGNIKKYDTSLG